MRLADSAGKTDPGRKRRHNEDAFVLEPPLFAVADGMGGAQAGEVAARIAAAVFREYHEADELAPPERMSAIIQEANRRIYERAQSDANASGMGTTVTAAIVESGRVAIGHVGDSRAYRLRDGRLEQLTQDHSLVADLLRDGRLTPEEAEAHPQRSVITRALGTDSRVDVDTQTADTAPGDVFLLCSDGLTTMVSDERILELLQSSSSPRAGGEGSRQGREPGRRRGQRHRRALRRRGQRQGPRGDPRPRRRPRPGRGPGGHADRPRGSGRDPGNQGARAAAALEETPAGRPRRRRSRRGPDRRRALGLLPSIFRRRRRPGQRHRLPGRPLRLHGRHRPLPGAVREPPPGLTAVASRARGALRPRAGLLRRSARPRQALRGTGLP